MNQDIFTSLIYNAALLLSLGIIFDALTLRTYRFEWWSKILAGIALGCIAIAIMVNPWILRPGIVFDTRSILLSLIGMFFGAVPAIISAAMAVGFRIVQGGDGVYMGCSVVIASLGWGYAWKRLHSKFGLHYTIWEFYALGIVNHLTMLGLTILLPAKDRFMVLATIALPVMLIYPLATVLLGQLLVRRLQIRIARKRLEYSEKQFRSLYENAPMPYQSLDEQGNFIAVNLAWQKALGYDAEEIIGKNFRDLLDPDTYEHFAECFGRFRSMGYINSVQHTMRKKDGTYILTDFSGVIVNDENGRFLQTQCVFTDVTEKQKQEAALRSIEWMLTKQNVAEDTLPSYGDLSALNTNRLILDSVGKDVLQRLVSDYLSLLDTSSAVYEKNGDYAIGIFSSSWCQYLDYVSRSNCHTQDNVEALQSGDWLCHESCWTDVSKKTIETREVVDMECAGGLHLYGVPIKISSGVIGAINLGYGSPPTDPEVLREIALKFNVSISELQQKAAAYQTRPTFIIEQAKRKLHTAAMVIGEIVERKLAEDELLKIKSDWEIIFQSIPHPTFILDREQNIIAANKYLENIFGISSKNMKGKKCWEMMHGDETTSPPIDCPFALSCISGNYDHTSEMELANLGRWYLITCKPVYDTEGNIDKVIHIAMDITERKQAELSLAESEEKYRLLSETAQDIILIHDLEGRVPYANAKALEFLGVCAEELSSINLNNYIPETYYPMLQQHIQQRKEGFLGSRLYPIELINKDNKVVPVEVSSTPIINNEKITGILAVIRDISERLEGEEAVKESQERFEIFMDNLPGAVYIKDSKSNMLYVNKYILNQRNMMNDIGKSPHEIYCNEIAENILLRDKLTLEQGVLNIIEEIDNPDGSISYYDSTKFILPNPKGEPMIGGVSLDVTQRIKAEDQRERYAYRLEILRKIDSIVLETLSFDSVCIAAVQNLHKLIPFDVLSVNVLSDDKIQIHTLYKPEQEYKYLNSDHSYIPNMEFIASLTKERTIIVNDARSETTPDDMPIRKAMIAEGISSFMYNAMIMQDEMVGFLWFSCKDKDFFSDEYAEIANEFANQLAIVLHHLRLIQRIKEHAVELEQKVVERTRQLTTSNQELEAFSYSVAHDLRAPLRTIEGYCTILIEDYTPSLHEEAINLLDTIRRTSRRMDTLIKELLELAKLTRNDLKCSPLNMKQIATDICKEVLNLHPETNYDLTIDELPGCYGDNALIIQVWQNLIENAVKFSHKCDKRAIHIGFIQEETENVYYVQDSGVGFDMAYVDKIFAPFQRLHRESEFEGTGIGLAIVKKVIDRHNGKVWAESTIGTGTCVYFSLPITDL